MDATLSPALSLLGKGEGEDFAARFTLMKWCAPAAAKIFSLSSLGARRGQGRGVSCGIRAAKSRLNPEPGTLMLHELALLWREERIGEIHDQVAFPFLRDPMAFGFQTFL